MPTYTAHGLSIDSELPLPGVPPTDFDSTSDVSIREGSVDTTWVEAGLRNGPAVDARPGELRLATDHGSVAVREGAQIVVDRRGKTSSAGLLPMLVGPALGMCLHQRGRCVLHASAVAIDGRAVAFLGHVGAGKSTVAAELHRRGHGVLADDIVSVSPDSPADRPAVHPGFPLVKLDAEAAKHLATGAENGDWPVGDVVTGWAVPGKRFYRFDREGAEALSLSTVYLLDTGAQSAVPPVAPQERVLAMLRHAYARRWLEATDTASRYFRRCSELADEVRTRRVVRPESLDRLGAVAEAVERDQRLTDGND